MKAFPLFITLTNRSVLVFGGGEEAAAKLRLLLKTDARVIAVAATFEAAVLDLEGVERIQAEPLTYALPRDVPFVYAATGDEALDADIAARVRSAGVLVCAADQPAVSDFSTPAIVDRDPVVVAIGTEGTAPVLARNLKAQIEFMLEPGLGLIARAAADLRPLVAKTLAAGKPRRAFWQRFFGSARAETSPTAASLDALGQSLLNDQAAPALDRSILFVGTGSGQVNDLTIAAHKAIDEADVVLADPLVSRAVLELARREAVHQRVPLGDAKSILESGAAGQSIVRLVAGSGRLAEDEIDALRQAGLRPQVIRGLSPIEAEDPAPRRARPTLSFLNRKAA